MRKRYRSVELLGVPSFLQGTHDSLCTYYTAGMLLATLHPEYQDLFGRGARHRRVGLKVEDPLIKNFPGAKKAADDQVLSSWFYGGAYLIDAYNALEETMKEDGLTTLFKYKQRNHTLGAFKIIADENINRGLPVMIGWNTVDLGVHCALVVGYRRANRNWLILHDPSCGYDEVCWEVLKDIDRSRLDLVTVDYHDGPRPDRLTVAFNTSKRDTKPKQQIDRWWPHSGEVGYHPVARLYEMAKKQ